MFRRRSITTLTLCTLALALTGFALAKEDEKSPLEGKTAPDLAMKTLDDKDVKLSEQKGSVVVLDFWATWCPPCRESLPHINKLASDKALAAKGLKVWAVNAHEDKAKVEAFVKKNSYSFNVPLSTKEQMAEYQITGIPTTVVVGRDGTVKKLIVGYGPDNAKSDKELEDAIDAALAEAAGSM